MGSNGLGILEPFTLRMFQTTHPSPLLFSTLYIVVVPDTSAQIEALWLQSRANMSCKFGVCSLNKASRQNSYYSRYWQGIETQED